MKSQVKFIHFHSRNAFENIICEMATIRLNVLTGDTYVLLPWLIIGAVNSLRPRLNRRPFTDDIFKCIVLNENEWISPRISLKFVPKFHINNIPALIHIMASRRSGGKPLSEPMMVSLPMHICVTRPQWINGMPPILQQALTWTSDDLSSIRQTRTNFSETSFEINCFSKINWRKSFAKYPHFILACVCIDGKSSCTCSGAYSVLLGGPTNLS